MRIDSPMIQILRLLSYKPHPNKKDNTNLNQYHLDRLESLDKNQLEIFLQGLQIFSR